MGSALTEFTRVEMEKSGEAATGKGSGALEVVHAIGFWSEDILFMLFLVSDSKSCVVFWF